MFHPSRPRPSISVAPKRLAAAAPAAEAVVGTIPDGTTLAALAGLLALALATAPAAAVMAEVAAAAAAAADCRSWVDDGA